MKTRDLFTTVRTEGGLLPPDLLGRIVEGGRGLDGLAPESYHLQPGESFNEAVNRAWNRMRTAWPAFRAAAAKVPAEDAATGLTRERWLLVLFQELGFGRLVASRSVAIDGKEYPISHFWQSVPIHLVGFRVDLGKRTPGVAGAARTSPHGLVQEFLNRSTDHLWGIVSNGLQLRLLRDNASLTRQAFVEFDLEAMMDGEVYPDFVLLWLLCHQSRFESPKPEECWLERWAKTAQEQGTRAMEGLREGVEAAIKALGTGFVAHSANNALRERLRAGTLAAHDYYRQLLRLAYRLIFLFVAEDRDLLHPRSSVSDAVRNRYRRYYSVSRLRALAQRRRGTKHRDLYQSLRVVMEKLGSDDGCPALALPALGSFLWSRDAIADLAACEIANNHLLDAIRHLSLTKQDRSFRLVDWKNLGTEELGSVYESLLELHPRVDAAASLFDLDTAPGHERKTTGSYYTPASLVQCLLDSALNPVLDEASRKPDPERAILSLKVCDPACGSGHFLIAAAHRMAKRLAAVRTGDEEPSPDVVRTALRDVIGHCIYGVDINPMAVELCKVSLWMEAIEPGIPLSFLDHRILCGNSLLGTTPALMEGGIPDEAFNPIEGDDKKFASGLKKQNRKEREGLLGLPFVEYESFTPVPLAETLTQIDAIADVGVAGIHEKEARYTEMNASDAYRRARLAADAWCAAFVWKKTKDAPLAITQDMFRRISTDPNSVPLSVIKEVNRLAAQYKFVHWHVAFPDVFRTGTQGRPEEGQTSWHGGFDVVLGNPPWERIKLQEREWFATARPDIANAPNAAARRRLIEALAAEDPSLFAAFRDDLRRADGESHLVRESARYPLCGRGDVNTYAIFAELKRSLISAGGRVGCIVPSGIATDDTTKHFFQDLIERRSLASLYDFENRDAIFPGVHRSYKFCLLTMVGNKQLSVGSGTEPIPSSQFVFFAYRVEDLRDQDRRFTLSASDIALLNPNTRTCPIFRSKKDAELTKAIYHRVPVLIREVPPQQNPWGVSFIAMFHMANDSHLFRTREQLDSEGWTLAGSIFERGDTRYLPLYEAKMVHHFDHRWATYDGLETRDLSGVEKRDPTVCAMPRYWVPESEVEDRLVKRDRSGREIWRWRHTWLLGWRNVCRNTDERTCLCGVVPRAGVGHSMPVLSSVGAEPPFSTALYACLCCFAFDYCLRQKLGGINLTYGYLNQLPIMPPHPYSQHCQWDASATLQSWLLPRVLELAYTAWDLSHFARDCGYDGPPFRWDEDRRFLLRCELDAAFFHLYLGTSEEWQCHREELQRYFSTPREAADYIMDTFPIVKRKDEARFGEYRTKRAILEIYDAMAEAAGTGVVYKTLLDPPPADPRVAHPLPLDARRRGLQPAFGPATVLPFRRVEPREDDKYRTCVPLYTLKAAAGAFGSSQPVDPDGWVEIHTSHKLRSGMFVAQVVGRSMEPRIPDGSYCLFASPVQGDLNGRILLVQHHSISDPETGGSYTVKRYVRDMAQSADRPPQHAAVRLEPLNSEYDMIRLQDDDGNDIRVIGEYLDVLVAKE